MGNDPLDDLGRELRDRVAGDFRRAAEDEEHDARLVALRSRTLSQVAFELMSRGDTIAAEVAGQIYTGTIIHTRGDLATIEAKTGDRVHVDLSGPVVLQIVERARQGGKTFDKFGPESFRARLRELELERAHVSIQTNASPRAAIGRIDIVAKDHIVVVDEDTNGTSFIPTAGVVAVMQRMA